MRVSLEWCKRGGLVDEGIRLLRIEGAIVETCDQSLEGKNVQADRPEFQWYEVFLLSIYSHLTIVRAEMVCIRSPIIDSLYHPCACAILPVHTEAIDQSKTMYMESRKTKA